MKQFRQQLHQNCLSAFRRKWGLSQQQVADQMQVSRSAIGMFEQGRRSIPTNILIQLAQLEIKTASRDARPQVKGIYPGADAMVIKCRNHCEQLELRESYCRAKADQLNEKLKIMIELHQKTTAWHEVILMHIKEAGDNKNVLFIWKKQELLVMRTLSKCSLHAQLLLKHTIDSLNEEAELHKNKHLQLKQDLATIILPGQEAPAA